MATGLARGAAARGKRIAFGDGKRIRWDSNSAPIFMGNPNIAPPGSERAPDIEWIKFYKGDPGSRIYNEQQGNRWVWRPDRFKATPGQIFFTDAELAFAKNIEPGFIVIEPNVPAFKTCAPNKQWPVVRYEEVARELVAAGYRVVQFGYPKAKYRLRNASYMTTPSFRCALAAMKKARMAVLPEGGLHHGAAAIGLRAVVLFGGFITPAVTGYDSHINLTGGAEACGSLKTCPHCIAAMDAITVEDVLSAANGILANG